MLKNYCAFVTFAERKNAENAMNALFNKLTIKDEKYRLSWGKIRDPDRLDDDEDKEDKEIKKRKLENEQYTYTTEFPIFDTNNISATTIPSQNKTKIIYSVNLNTYDKGYKPYYPSMDANAMGGELKINSKKKMKIENRGRDNNSLNKLIQAYQDDNK
jgi:hypothetical protein